jgi:hypothetical protein
MPCPFGDFLVTPRRHNQYNDYAGSDYKVKIRETKIFEILIFQFLRILFL